VLPPFILPSMYLLRVTKSRDAGIALASYLSHVVSQPESMPSLAKTLQDSTSQSPRVMELGSGCGIVGLEIAHLCPMSDVYLTDLPEAMDILNHNIIKAEFTSTGDRVTAAVLDWNKPLPDNVAKNRYDLLIVSDCTYNCDSIPALVRTLAALIANSPAALIIVSMKVRHDSEAIFFDLMAGAGLVETDSVTIGLPDRIRQETQRPLGRIDVYVYGKATPDQHS
jgi:predicted nicotinamide N-methyase